MRPALVIVLGAVLAACNESGLSKLEPEPVPDLDGSGSQVGTTPTTPAGTGGADPTASPSSPGGTLGTPCGAIDGTDTTTGAPADTGSAVEPEPDPEPLPEPEPELPDTGGAVVAEEPAEEPDVELETLDTGTDVVLCDPGMTPADLDLLQVAGDGRVVYCHETNGAEGHVLQESDIPSCEAHLGHADIFPTTGCDT